MNSEESAPRFKWKYSMSTSEVTLLLLFVILFLPSFSILRSPEGRYAGTIGALMWRVLFYRDGTISLILEPNLLIFPYFGLKYLLVFQFYRYYNLSTTKKRVLLLAILCELQMMSGYAGTKILEVIQGLHPTFPSLIYYFPLPITLISSIVLMVLVPRPESEPMWIDKEEANESWWTREGGKKPDIN